MYNKIKTDIKATYYQQHYANDGQRFVAWYLRNIYRLDELQSKDCITDGTDDKQIDAVYINDSTLTIHIIQGKFIGNSTIDAEPLREVLSSWIQLMNLVNLQEISNIKLKQKLADISDALEDDYDLSFELLTTSNLTTRASEDFRNFQEKFSSDENLPADLVLVDNEELSRRYDIALDNDNPDIIHTIQITSDQTLRINLGDKNLMLIVLPLVECIKFPGIKDQSLFRKNVRQTLGLSNEINKGIKSTIYTEPENFFLFHNGITAICTSMIIRENQITVSGFNVVNGCQSLNTILSCSEKIRETNSSKILLRLYEIKDNNHADRISIYTNSQSPVKARDLRSNDKRVKAIKRSYEQRYSKSYLLTKRGEKTPADRDLNFVIDLPQLGKYLISWHSQRPISSYSENKIFDKYFNILFRKDYDPQNIQALNEIGTRVLNQWVPSNPLKFNESLLAMKSFAPYHHMYAVSICFCVLCNKNDSVPSPHKALELLKSKNMLDKVIEISGVCLNMALETAANEPQPRNRVFSPQNWMRTKGCLSSIKTTIRNYFLMLPTISTEGAKTYDDLSKALVLSDDDFMERWTAD